MDPGPPSADRDARLLGLALLHGYVEAEQLRRAALADPAPSRILAELRRSGALDEPCLEGLVQALRAFAGGPLEDRGSEPTRLESARHLAETDAGPGATEPIGRWSSGTRLLQQFSVPQWKQYRDLRFIGEGGMGRIYRALDPDLKRTVALKFLRSQDPGQLQRFLFEAQAQALLDHPNICRVHEISEWQGQHYIAMQFVNGPTLLRAAPNLPFQEKLEIARVVAEAVHAAHRRGLIHRDLKPANVMLERDEQGRARPFVLDFGLAREQDAPGLTLSGLVIGTGAYLSPEQARGESHHVDRRTDVYGLGATLFELFAGRPPFGDAQGLDCLRKVVEEEPPRLRSLVPGLPRDLETVVMKCLEKDPARRYDDAQALAEDLRRIREGEPIQAVPVTALQRAARFARRNRALVAVTGVAALGVLVFAGLAGWTRYAAAVRERHVQQFSQEAERIESLLRYLRLLPSQNLEPHMQAARDRLARLEADVRSAGRLARGPGAYAVGRSLLAFGEVDRALPLLQAAGRENLRGPALAHALGRCYGLIYQRELERAGLLPDPALRAARRQEVEAQWRTPALGNLRASRGASLEPPEYLEALLDTYDGRHGAALEKVRRTSRTSPWIYEALGLEGEVLLTMARESQDPETATALLAQASSALAAARRVAPSDVALWLGEARVARERVQRLAHTPEAEVDLERCRAAVAACRSIRPSDPGPLLQVAWSLRALAVRRVRAAPEKLERFQEALDLVAQVRAVRPEDPEARVAQVQLLEGLAVWRRNEGQDPAPILESATAAAREALAAMPGTPELLSAGALAAHQLMAQRAANGGDPEPAFATALGWAQDLGRRYPELGYGHQTLAQILVEHADLTLARGGDPRPDLDRAGAALDAARRATVAPVVPEAHRSSQGDLHLIRGQYLLALGEPAATDLEAAIAAYSGVLEARALRASNHAELAEACLGRAQEALTRGGDPGPWLRRAHGALDQALARERHYYHLRQLKGQALWLEARHLEALGRPPAAAYAEALRWLGPAAADGRTARAHAALARAHLDRARSSAALPGDLARGLAAADRALAVNPRSAEASLLSGQLRQLQTDPAAAGEARARIDRALALNPLLRRRAERPGAF